MSEQRVTVNTAAQAVAQSTATIYQWIRDGEISVATDRGNGRGYKMVLMSEVRRQAGGVPIRFSVSSEAHMCIEEIAHAEKTSKRAAFELIVKRAWAEWYKAKEAKDVTDV